MNTLTTKKKWQWILGIVAIVLGSSYLVYKTEIGTVTIPSNVSAPAESLVTEFTVPEGFEMNVFARDVEGARVMLFDSKGRMLVSQTDEGSVAILTDTNSDGVAEEQKVLVKGLNHPHGMVFECNPVRNPECHLYVAEADQLTRFSYDAETATVDVGTNVLDLEYNATDRHKTRSLVLHNEHTILISVGSTCNVCNEKGTQAGKVILFDINDSTASDFATGLRNAVFLTKSFVDGSIWMTEMGRDGLGDTTPPDEINIYNPSRSSGTRGVPNFGWPICYSDNIHDTNFDKKTYIQDPCNDTIKPVVKLPAHVAPLGLSFIPEEGWDESMWYNLLVAEHGSWNSSTPVGYKVVRVVLDEKGNYSATEDFVTGWLRPDGKKIGRPADVMALPGGVVYISDDEAGIIYRLARTGEL